MICLTGRDAPESVLRSSYQSCKSSKIKTLKLLFCTIPSHEVFSHFGATCLPNMGKLLSQHGQARCPTWAHFVVSFLPNILTFEDEQYGVKTGGVTQ